MSAESEVGAQGQALSWLCVGGNSKKRIWLVYILIPTLVFLMAWEVSAAPPLKPDTTYPTGTEAGRELAATLRSFRPEENVKWRGVFRIFGRGHKITPISVQCQTTLGGTNWSVEYSTGGTESLGAEKLTIIFSTNGPNQYFYARAISPVDSPGEARKITGAEADKALASSDFWLSDLGFEFYHWPDQKRLPIQTKSGRPCHVLESSNPNPNPDGYSRVVTWVDIESSQPLLAEAYGSDKELLKSYELGSVEKINGRYQARNLKIFNRKTHSRTELDIDLEK